MCKFSHCIVTCILTKSKLWWYTMTRKIILMTSIAALFAVLLTSTSLASAEEAPEFLFEWGS